MGMSLSDRAHRSASDRAGRASPEPRVAPRLGHSATIPCAAAFTPGPWTRGKDGRPELRNECNLIEAANGRLVAYGQMTDADAILIAAAPDLYEACEFVREWLIEPFTPEELDDPNYNESFRKAGKAVLAALAKAQGKAR